MESVKALLPPTVRAPVAPEITPAKVSALAVLTVSVLPALIAKLPPLLPFKSVILKLFCALKVPLSVRAPAILPVLETVNVLPELTVVNPVYVLVPAKVSVPAPFTVKAPEPLIAPESVLLDPELARVRPKPPLLIVAALAVLIFTPVKVVAAPNVIASL